MRKMFLSLANIVCEVLVPLCNGSICFPDIEKMSDKDENKYLREFAVDYKTKIDLFDSISELRKYFEENGGNVPFCRATLNPKTKIKNPSSTDNSIEAEIEKIGMEKYLQTTDEIITAINKIKQMQDSKLPLIKRALLFKYKTIPAVVQFDLAKSIGKKLNKEEQELRTIIRTIGQTASPAKDYADLQHKKEFNINQYPLKPAFDYAWESLAKAEYHNDIEFPNQICKQFLKDIFNVDTETDSYFKLYAQFLYLRELLATLEHSQPTNPEKIVKIIEELLEKINAWKEIDDKNSEKYKTAISNWLKTFNKEDNNFKNAKQKIGLFRGGLKKKAGDKSRWEYLRKPDEKEAPKLTAYNALTQIYKDIATNLGRNLADMRDKITNESELNKISHYAAIIEDKNGDKYVLLKKSDKDEEFALPCEKDAEYKTYIVNSITSSAIAKMIRKKRAADLAKNIRLKSEELNDEQKEAKNLKDWIELIKKQQYDFEFNLNLNNKNFEQIKKEIDAKCYQLQKGNISKQTLEKLINEQKEWLLLPIINQDLAKRDKSTTNQFSKDWQKIFSDKRCGYRLTPEFRISYRKPTPNYPQSQIGDKRYSRFQMIAHFLCDYIPQGNLEYKSTRQQIEIFKDYEKQEESVRNFTYKIYANNDYLIFGIDRGLKQLATLCVLNKEGKIYGGFDIYTRSFNKDKKQWEHSLSEKRNILDLSDLRVEKTITGEKVLVDLNSIKVKGNQDNQQKIKLKELAYIRKLQFKMQTEHGTVINFINKYRTPEEIQKNIHELITPYKEGEHYADLPTEKICNMLQKFKEFSDKNDGKSKRELIELDSAGELKNGIVANMVGVVAYLLEKYKYNVYISLEDLTRAYRRQTDGLDGRELFSSNDDKSVDFKDQENTALAGLGTYHFFEIQLLRKLFRIQQEDGNILHLVPAFRSVDDYEKIIRRDKKIDGNEYVDYPFGIVRFVDPKNTSKRCPLCSSININRHKNIIKCQQKACGFKTPWDKTNDKNIQYIQNGDENGAYHIAKKTLDNLNNKK